MKIYQHYRLKYPELTDAGIIEELHNKFEEQAKAIARLTQDYEEIQYDLKQMKLDRESSRGFFKDIPKLVKPTGE